MGVRNCKDIGENLQKIAKRLLANEELVKLLYYTDKDPLSQPNLTPEQKEKEIFEKLIKIVPIVRENSVSKSIISIRVDNGKNLDANPEFKRVAITVEIFVPLTQWIIKDTNLRPFAIMGQIQESLNDKKINGLGKLKGGDFNLSFITQETSCYEQYFGLESYD
jgi:hypothetical protein